MSAEYSLCNNGSPLPAAPPRPEPVRFTLKVKALQPAPLCAPVCAGHSSLYADLNPKQASAEGGWGLPYSSQRLNAEGLWATSVTDDLPAAPELSTF